MPVTRGRRHLIRALVALAGVQGVAAAAVPGGKPGSVDRAPAPPPAVQVPAGPPMPARQDWWLMAGLTTFTSGSVVGYRVEAGKPLTVQGYPGLRALLVLYFNHWSASASVPGISIDISASTLAVFPSVQYEWLLGGAPSMRFSVLPELGVGPAVAWVRMPDFPFMPAHYETHYATVARLGASLQLATSGGLLLALQPVAGYFNLQQGTLSSDFELGVRAGYQFP